MHSLPKPRARQESAAGQNLPAVGGIRGLRPDASRDLSVNLWAPSTSAPRQKLPELDSNQQPSG